MDNSEFEQIAEETLGKIVNSIDDQDLDNLLDADKVDDIVSITLPDGQEYIINKRDAKQEIWLTSPVFGTCHFFYDEVDEVWLDSDDNELFSFLAEELKDSTGIEIDFHS